MIDDEIAYISSMNMVDPAYFKQNAGVGQWIDIMVRVTGPTVNVLSAIHCWDWEFETYHACCRKIRNAASNRISLSIQSKLSLLALVCLRI